jgi:rhodanese-related sulfurtransferase
MTVDPAALAKERQTSLGLYVTAREAYERWHADPEGVRILDVRTPEEYVFVGHAPMATNIPLAFQSFEWDRVKKGFHWDINPGFLPAVQAWAKPGDTLLVSCRSGGRSAMAIELLAKAGYTDAWNIVDGMEGGQVKDPDSVFLGMRMKNGWKNSGLPWTYEIDRDRMVLPRRESTDLQPGNDAD